MDTPTAPLLAAVAVESAFGSRPVLRGVDLDIHAGGSLALVGSAGSGCSTLLRALNRTEPIDAGEMLFRGSPLPDGGAELATLRADVALVLPAFNLPPNHPVRHSIVAGARRIRGWPDDRATAAADAALERVGLPGDDRRLASELDPGAAQRAAIARALALDAAVLLLDGPTVGLTGPEADGLRELLAELTREVTVVVATDDEALVRGCVGRAVRLERGRIVADGEVSAVLAGAPEA